MDIQSLFSVKDKVVLVTGGAKGVGRMISEAFVRNGAKVYISSRDAAACRAACAELNALPGARGADAATPLPADLSRLDECRRLARELAAREPALHVLVHNSGATWGEAYDAFPDAAWSKLLALNLQRVFSLTQALTPLLEAAAASAAQQQQQQQQPGSSSSSSSGSGSGGEAGGPAVAADPARVIHIGSIDGIRVPALPTFAYSASKAGLHQLSRHLAAELGPRGITSNTLACGPFPSRMMAATLREFGDTIRAANPLGRIGAPSDVGGACLFLASRAGAFVNGATLVLDGGLSLMSKI
ncbi:9d064c8d-2430-40e4-addb-3e2bacb2faf8 [Thermothielavioides terrestris]|uniref:9d064c8d-2430-40e4-addb-3e2bacb2faf8 n=1 Tax=Thermothielavioides terrestris TaxID=2587410 RepID=A0A3S4ASY0_9PEZI|nr:9d064c8d-2430-40e4-addb-3e2bacb2faf8 [Thermothielavioides terrestris]